MVPMIKMLTPLVLIDPGESPKHRIPKSMPDDPQKKAWPWGSKKKLCNAFQAPFWGYKKHAIHIAVHKCKDQQVLSSEQSSVVNFHLVCAMIHVKSIGVHFIDINIFLPGIFFWDCPAVFVVEFQAYFFWLSGIFFGIYCLFCGIALSL